jgi:hypothetical protein
MPDPLLPAGAPEMPKVPALSQALLVLGQLEKFVAANPSYQQQPGHECLAAVIKYMTWARDNPHLIRQTY